ncbi:uncharacterized protein [Garra rufa]|uniref:uncharacterized protein n=1 Tax=Garra rufa TaxID=137080 RepID=UPI003CCECBED
MKKSDTPAESVLENIMILPFQHREATASQCILKLTLVLDSEVIYRVNEASVFSHATGFLAAVVSHLTLERKRSFTQRHKDPSIELFSCSMSEERLKVSPSEMSLPQKQSQSSGSHVSSSVSVKSDQSKGGVPNFSEKTPSSIKSVRSGSYVSSSVSVKSGQSKGGVPNFSEKTPSSTKSVRSGSLVSSSVSVKSDQSKGGVPNFSEEAPSSIKRVQHEKSETNVQKIYFHKKFRENLHWIFQDLENKIITFLKNELKRFKKILKKENTQYSVTDFIEDMCRIKEAALNITLYFLRDMKYDEAANTLEDEQVFFHLKSNLKKKYQCVFEGIAKQGDSTLLNSIYTDLYITQGGSEQVNTEHEVRQIEVTSRHQESQEIQVECTSLFRPGKDKKIRTVLTKGVAGIGKSVSVQKFVLDWTEGKQNQDISFIFPLPFREMNLKDKEKHSLMDLITQFFPETKRLNLAKRNMYKVLFILDGLDEFRLPLNFDGNETWSDISSPASLDVLLTNLIKGNLLPSALIWITTRPAAASKIPPDCIDRVTEIRGFNDAQKEEYFKKRFTDENLGNKIIDHVKKSKSLFIMCHIPVFCWISATVLQNILEMTTNDDLKNNQAYDASKTLQESNTEETPKTLTQMYTHFLRFQILQSRRKYDGEYTPDVSWDKDAILSLGRLAFHQLEKNNLIFYDTDLEACGIDVYKASVYSGMCTQIFKEETGITVGTMYCFVHLSIQEFIAALYAHLFLDINSKTVFVKDSTEQEKKKETMIDLLKTAVDKALKSDSGHLDLFLRFLLGLSLQSNRRLLRGLLTQQDDSDQSIKQIVQYIKQKFEGNLSPERSINLFYCLNELNDHTLVKDIQIHLSKGSLSSGELSPAQWSALAFVLLTSEEELEEFELQKFKKSDECLIRLSSVIKTTKRALLCDCGLKEESCSALATVLISNPSLKELDMSNNNLQDSGVKKLGLENTKCTLEKLRLSNCSITEEGYKALASALRSNPSHLIELDLTGNDPGHSGVKELNDLLQDPNCQLKTLRFLGPDADEACQYVTGIVGKNPLLLRELNLSGHELGDTRVNQISSLLQDKHCKLNTLMLNNNSITAEGCAALNTAFNSNPSNLIELDLSGNKLESSGIVKICFLLENPQCRLEKLKLSNCSITEEGYKALASALRSNPSHLIELDLTGNDPGQSGVEELNDLLQDPNCQLNTLRFLGPAADEACQYVNGIVGKNPLLLRELNLSECKLGDTRMNQIAALLQDKHCKLNTLILSDCSITEEGYKALASALRSNPSHLIELDLTGNDPGQSGVKELNDLLQNGHFKLKFIRFLKSPAAQEVCDYLTKVLGTSPLLLKELDLSEDKLGDLEWEKLSALLMDSHSKLEKIKLNNCELTEKSCSVLATVLSSKTILKEIDLNNSRLLNSGVKQICEGLKNPVCELKILKLSDCSITEEGYKALASALRSNPSHLIELDLRGNDPGQSGVKELNDLLQDPNSQLKTLRFLGPAADEACQYVTGIVGKSPLLLRELNLSGHELGDTRVNQIAALLQDKHCKLNTLILCSCSLTEESCSALATVLKSKSSLTELDMSDNNLRDSGVKKLQNGLENTNCTLQKLRLSNCSITEEGYKALASALRSNPSHLIELDLTGNDPGQSGVKELSDLLQDPNCKLKLRFLSPSADEACQDVNRVLGENLLLLRELNLSECKLGPSGLKKLATVLKDKHCKLNTLILNNSNITDEDCCVLTEALNSNPSNLTELNLSGTKLKNSGMKIFLILFKNEQCRLKRLKLNSICITEEGCAALVSALNSNPSNLIELDLSGNTLLNSGVTEISTLLGNSQCILQILRLSDCSITEEGYKALASALRSNPSHLIELDLTGNDPGQSGVKELNDLLQDPNCQLKTLRFLGPAAEEACQFVTGIVGKSPLLLTELKLSGHELGDTRVNQIAALLQDKHCKLKTVMLKNNSITEEGCAALTSAFNSNPSNLIELDLSGNKLGYIGMEKICLLLENPQCKLEKLKLSDCSITEEGYKALASALRSNPSNLIELDLTGNDPGQSGVNEFKSLLQDEHYKFAIRFLKSPAAEEACEYLTKVLRISPLFLIELDLSEDQLRGLDEKNLSALLMDSHSKLEKIKLNNCKLTEKSCRILATVLSTKTILKEMDLNNSRLLDSGVKEICKGLKTTLCELKILKLSNCSISENGYTDLASALRSNPSHLIELDLTGNDPGQSGVKELNDLLQDPNCQLKTLRFLRSPNAEEACQYLTRIVGKNPLLLRELNLSGHELGDTRVNQIAALLQDKHCQLNTLTLCGCSITEKQCLILTSALSLKSNPSHLRELDLSENKLGDSGFTNLSDLLMNPQCKLEILVLCKCSINLKQCLILTSALKSNPSHLRELNLKLDLSGSKLGDSGAENLGVLLGSSRCKLKKLHLRGCSITEKQCFILTSALCSNLRKLDLSGNKIENKGVKHLCGILNNERCKLERLSLHDCGITDVADLAQSLAETKALQFLKQLDLSKNSIGSSKDRLIDVLQGSKCNLILDNEQSLLRTGVNYISGLSNPLARAQDPVESTEQESLSDEESS